MPCPPVANQTEAVESPRSPAPSGTKPLAERNFGAVRAALRRRGARPCEADMLAVAYGIWTSSRHRDHFISVSSGCRYSRAQAVLGLDDTLGRMRLEFFPVAGIVEDGGPRRDADGRPRWRRKLPWCDFDVARLDRRLDEIAELVRHASEERVAVRAMYRGLRWAGHSIRPHRTDLPVCSRCRRNLWSLRDAAVGTGATTVYPACEAPRAAGEKL